MEDMMIIPAIDLKGGKVVRLFKGLREREKVYSSDPSYVAKMWEEKGAKMLHVVDLDGAFEGRLKNLKEIKIIVDSVNVPVQVGGGLRDSGSIRKILDIGAERVILGTRAIQDTLFLQKVVEEFKKKIWIGLDIKEGKIALKGWKHLSNLKVEAFLEDLKKYNIGGIIFTDITRDGTLQGTRREFVEMVSRRIFFDFIISGGVTTVEDIKRLKEYKDKGLKGIIIGKALYDKVIELEEAIRVFEGG
jgi:phosphoribosylformimino-5-aminoimidazole carboxamide ribotide isomerase